MGAPAYEVVIVGGGNAALCAALSAREHGESVLVLERAPQEQRGGNSAYTGGGFRMVHEGVETVRSVVPDLSQGEIENTDFGSHSAEQYLDDLGRDTQWHCDPDLAETLVRNSTETVQWLHGNAAIRREVPFNPNIKDGRCTVGLEIEKSNWATAIEKPPLVAYAVTCGITFTFGGLKTDAAARVLDIAERPIGGLYAAGELVGGLFYFNYPGSSGLMAGSVFGRIAGRSAAAHAHSGERA
jgi:succinate dehydrogenase/fumarate reductase flavoprotein subunit